MSFSARSSGFDKLVQTVEKAKQRIREEAAKELYRFGEEIMAASKDVVPVDTGNLMNSGHVEMPPSLPAGGNPAWGTGLTAPEGELLVVLAYGGPAAKYALYVHEALEGPRAVSLAGSWAKAAARRNAESGRLERTADYIHWKRPGSGPKYLENPFKERQDELPGRMAAAMRRALKP